ncbi:ATP-binding protein [Actinomadura miaoliensis]|uniref:Schlafen AlbA-2 domain-containing protein n=1 Tax=Actinomadura miaoliensis TaxID=430685 RepID=A0ABP7VEX0_9ACTN
MPDKEWSLHLEDRTIRATSFNEFDLDVDASELFDVDVSSICDAANSFAKGRANRISYLDETTGHAITSSLNLWLADGHLPWEDPTALIIARVAGQGLSSLAITCTCPFEISVNQFLATIAPVVAKFSATILSIGEPSAPANSWELNLTVGPSTSLGNLFIMRRELAYAAFFPRTATHEPRLVLEMIRAGLVGNLIGVPESHCLEVKSAPYDMKNNGKIWKVELAQDVAKFANSEDGGLLVIGATSKRIGGVDTITKIKPIPPKDTRIQSYRQVLDAHIHPPISSIGIEAVPFSGGEILCIHIPPQHEESKPYLVQGGIFKGKYDAGVISIVRRRDEDCIPISAREIHAMLAAGRALFKRSNEARNHRPSTLEE